MMTTGEPRSPDEHGETLRDHRFHLVAGECAGDENVVEQALRRDPPSVRVHPPRVFPRELGQEVNVEPVRPVHERHRPPPQKHMRRRRKGDAEDASLCREGSTAFPAAADLNCCIICVYGTGGSVFMIVTRLSV
jgi:hypothetical protein